MIALAVLATVAAYFAFNGALGVPDLALDAYARRRR